MKKIFAFAAAAIFALSMNAKQVVFDFSDPASFGYAKAEGGKYTQVESGGTIEKDGVVITVSFPEGKNGFRFFTNTNTGVASLRGYVGASFTIAAPAGNNLFSVQAKGSNLGDTYVSGDLVAGAWVSETGVASIAGEIIKSTVYFDQLTVIIAAEGETPEIPTAKKVSVAEAIAAGNALDKGATSEQQYEVTGYVVNAEPFSNQHGNQIWWMSDDAANTDNQEFEAYACTIKEAGLQVINGDKVKLTGYITKYEDTKNGNKIIIEIKGGVAEFIQKAEGDHSILPDKMDTLSVPEAVVEALKLGNNEVSTKTYVVRGYVAKIKTPFSAQYNNISLFMTGDPNSTYGELQAYRIGMAREDSAKVVDHAYIQIVGKLKNNFYNDKNSAYIQDGNLTVAEAPAIQEIDVTTAMELGNALEDNAKTPDVYKVVGYVAKVQTPFEEGVETFFMSDDPEATFGDFQARLVTIADPGAKVGDRVAVVGQILKYVGASGNPTIQIDHGAAEVLAPQGIENITLTEKAQKVVVDGVIYIVRDNKMFNLQGAQVR